MMAAVTLLKREWTAASHKLDPESCSAWCLPAANTTAANDRGACAATPPRGRLCCGGVMRHGLPHCLRDLCVNLIQTIDNRHHACPSSVHTLTPVTSCPDAIDLITNWLGSQDENGTAPVAFRRTSSAVGVLVCQRFCRCPSDLAGIFFLCTHFIPTSRLQIWSTDLVR